MSHGKTTTHSTPNRRKPTRQRRSGKPSWLSNLFGQHMRMGWWIGGSLAALLYAWLFYYFFVSPTGFRWRALFGDANYPKGYEIHGVDISHYQGEIDWDKLRDAMIEGYPLRFILKVQQNLMISLLIIFIKLVKTDIFVALIIFGAISRRHVHRPIIFLIRCICKRATCHLCLMLNINLLIKVWKSFNKTSLHGCILLKISIM